MILHVDIITIMYILEEALPPVPLADAGPARVGQDHPANVSQDLGLERRGEGPFITLHLHKERRRALYHSTPS
jgi:hypothetical protein